MTDLTDLIPRAAALDVLVTSPNFHTTLTRIEELPAVNAAPVVHGRWIFHDDDIMPWVSCSECGVCTDSMNKTTYCPNCGAKNVEE